MTDVGVPRSTLRGIRSSVAVIVVGVVLIVVGMALKLASDHDRCQAGNDFRRNDLPAAFELSHRQIGESLGATDDQITEFDDGFQQSLAELLPERKCSWFG